MATLPKQWLPVTCCCESNCTCTHQNTKNIILKNASCLDLNALGLGHGYTQKITPTIPLLLPFDPLNVPSHTRLHQGVHFTPPAMDPPPPKFQTS